MRFTLLTNFEVCNTVLLINCKYSIVKQIPRISLSCCCCCSVTKESVESDSVTIQTAACQASMSFTNSWSCSNSHPLSQWGYLTTSFSAVPSLLAFNPSQHQSLFQWVGSLQNIRWPKYWSFSISISPSNEYSGLISFRMDWFDSLAIQENLKNLL